MIEATPSAPLGARSSVSVRDLTIAYGDLEILKEMNLDVRTGEFLVLLGPSGCGKSTLLNAIAGLNDIRSGQICIGDVDVTYAEPSKRGIGMVFQSYALYPRMTVEQNMSFGLRMTSTPKAEIGARVAEAARILQLEPLLKRRPAELSGGQRQRVAIGRALVKKAGVFLFDEPLSNLDAKLRSELRVELKRLHQDLDSTMIYVTHDQIEAMTLGDRVAVMKDGIIQQLGTPHEIYHRPANRFIASFIGTPGMNFIDGKVEIGPDGACFRSAAVDVPLTGYEPAGPFRQGPAVLGIRPEHIQPVPEDLGGPAMSVTLVEAMGPETIVHGRTGEDALALRVPGEFEGGRGDVLHLSVAAAKVNLFDTASGLRL
ncbi:ABC transporter ATP-binding protein [Agrobacterium sp. a22-2]|uniref:ABC transporter ATP-binding protein n=1 Tax=Agrobacterium sp. a22-2 TaxID=2283840 RepID=UPI0014489DEB|nr:ABC transporter ATP-binding protein [Agrobacterium sp. a22-2]NKN37450.1 ABC transporter ATP-binding protein [Agrobacterium sp. a22-2]